MLPIKFVNWPLGSGEEAKHRLYFQDSSHGGHNGFLIGMIIFDLQVTLILPTRIQVNWPFISGEEAKNRFSRWPWWPS